MTLKAVSRYADRPVDSTIMPPYQQQQAPQHWDRWQQHHTTDYAMMDGIVAYDPRSVPATTSVQRPTTMAPQYTIGSAYDGHVTPMSASPYGSQGQFGDYHQSCAYQSPTTVPSTYQQLSRASQRPLAPPTPPLDEERGLRLNNGPATRTVGSMSRDSPSRRSVSVVKSEASSQSSEMRQCPKFVKTDGSLQYESSRPLDILLRQLDISKDALVPQHEAAHGATPESMASPAVEEQESKAPKPEKKHMCQIPSCGRRFLQKAQLATHMLSHEGRKPFRCNFPGCGKEVTQRGNLKSHQRVHTSEKQFACPECGQRFKSKAGIKPHIQTKHLKAPKYQCPMKSCPKDFTTIGNMKCHINKYHLPEINHYSEMMARDVDSLDKETKNLLLVLKRIYKNSNCGIKGRGVDARPKDGQGADTKRELEQEMTPVSPDAGNRVHDYRASYYDQQPQPYQLLPHPIQHQSSYVPLPLQQSHHQTYQGLPAPGPTSGGYAMSWNPSHQYH